MKPHRLPGARKNEVTIYQVMKDKLQQFRRSDKRAFSRNWFQLCEVSQNKRCLIEKVLWQNEYYIELLRVNEPVLFSSKEDTIDAIMNFWFVININTTKCAKSNNYFTSYNFPVKWKLEAFELLSLLWALSFQTCQSNNYFTYEINRRKQ